LDETLPIRRDETALQLADGLFSAKAMPPFSLEILKIDRSLAIVPKSEPILIRQN
jgi:hypothetical protein